MQITLAFGVWPIVTLMEARRKQEEAKERTDKGINPIQEKREKGNCNYKRSRKRNAIRNCRQTRSKKLLKKKRLLADGCRT